MFCAKDVSIISKHLDLKLIMFIRFIFIDPIYDSDGIWYANGYDGLGGNELMRTSLYNHITRESGDPRHMTQHYAFLAGRNTSDWTNGVGGVCGAGCGTVCFAWEGSKFLSH